MALLTVGDGAAAVAALTLGLTTFLTTLLTPPDDIKSTIPIHYSTELKAFFTLLSENEEWTHDMRFVPIEHGAFIITRLDS